MGVDYMNFYERNVECIKQNSGYLYKQMQNWEFDISTSQIEKVDSVFAKDGEQVLVIQTQESAYRLNSSYNPSKEAEIWADQYNFCNINSVITMFGLGNGIFAREILKRRGKEDILLIYEPSATVFYHVLNTYDLTDILSEKFLVISVEGINEFEFHNMLQNAVNINNIGFQIQCIHPCYDRIYPNSCVNYLKELKDNYIHTKVSINTEIVFGKRLILNSLYNLAYFRNSYRLSDLAEDIKTEVPAIVVSAGPSLKNNMEALKRAKGKAYIFVVDRCLDFVLDQGLEPDFVVTIDPAKPIEYFTRRTDLNIPLLCELASNHEILERHKGKKIIYNCIPYIAKIYEHLEKKPPVLCTGTSVSTAAFAACVQLGFKRIVLVGQDLAYDGKYTHAGDVVEVTNNAIDRMVEGIDGTQIPSRYDWYDFVVWFEDMIKIYPDIEVIDAKLKGAKIHGTINMTLDDVINTYCTKEITNVILDSKRRTFNETEMIKIKKYLEISCEQLDLLKSRSEAAIRICNNQIKECKRNQEDSATSQKNYKKICKINKYLDELSVYPLLEYFITASSAQQLSEMYQFVDDKKRNFIDTYEKAISVYRAIVDGTEYLRPLLQETINHL